MFRSSAASVVAAIARRQRASDGQAEDPRCFSRRFVSCSCAFATVGARRR